MTDYLRCGLSQSYVAAEMPSIIDAPEVINLEDQAAFNLAVWEKVVADPFLAGLPHRIETDRYGQIIMSPPPAPDHGEEQFEIGSTLKKLLPAGHVITECPVSTSQGVRLIDVTWTSRDRRRAQRGKVCLVQAPEICVEVVSPGNTRRELREKKALFFAAGAEEVWLCHRDGRMEFFRKEAPETPTASALCPAFPQVIRLEE